MITGDYVLDGVLEKIKGIIGIEIFDGVKILLDTDDKLFGNSILKNVMILVSCVIKDNSKFYSQVFLEEALAA